LGGAITTGTTTISVGGIEEIGGGYTLSGFTISSGVTLEVVSGGTASNTTVSGNGSLVVLLDGFADSTTLGSGGSETIGAGGTDYGTQIFGGTQFDYSLVSGDTVFSGSQVVASGGTAVRDTISGGALVLDSGAVASGGIVFAGNGTLEILGSAMPTATISGFTSGDVIDLASVASTSGGIAILTSGNVLDVVEGGLTYVLDLNPSQNYSGTKFVLTSDGSGGTEVTNISNPISITVTSGNLTVSSGHTSGGVHVLSGATLNILSGGTASGAFIDKGGTDKVSGRDVSATLSGGLEVVSRSGVASNATILAGGSQTDLGATIGTVLFGGTETISTGGTASNTVVLSGGSLIVLSHGLADPATIYGGGSETISKGGTDLGVNISGGIQIDSGLASGATIFAGSQVVGSAGRAFGTSVSDGGTEIVSSGGTTLGTLLASGQETVLRGGHATGTVVSSGGYDLVSSGGTAIATTISGGTLEIAAGGTASGVVFSSSGGTLHLDSGSRLTGTISGFHLGDAINLGGLAFNASSSTLSWTQKTSGANASGTLTVKEGTQTQSLTLVGSYTASNFSAISDGHGGTLITDPPITSGPLVASPGTSSGSSVADIAPGSAATVISGGYELGAGCAAAGDMDSGSGTDRGAIFSGAGLVQLDSLLSELAGVISGFDFGDALDLRSLGFGRSPGAVPWMPQTSGGNGPASADGGRQIVSLALLGQYAAAFSAGADGHSDSMITDPPSAASVIGPPTSMTVAHS
jgi:autotransporter passenger strand-loop-strand repeat protein